MTQPSNWTPLPLDAEKLDLLRRAYKAEWEIAQEREHHCARCGCDLSERPLATYCHDCRRARNLAYMKERYQENPLAWKGVTGERLRAVRPPCVGCGAEMKGEHGSAKWCSDCRGDG